MPEELAVLLLTEGVYLVPKRGPKRAPRFKRPRTKRAPVVKKPVAPKPVRAVKKPKLRRPSAAEKLNIAIDCPDYYYRELYNIDDIYEKYEKSCTDYFSIKVGRL